jgi:hypothetical protein
VQREALATSANNAPSNNAFGPFSSVQINTALH